MRMPNIKCKKMRRNEHHISYINLIIFFLLVLSLSAYAVEKNQIDYDLILKFDQAKKVGLDHSDLINSGFKQDFITKVDKSLKSKISKAFSINPFVMTALNGKPVQRDMITNILSSFDIREIKPGRTLSLISFTKNDTDILKINARYEKELKIEILYQTQKEKRTISSFEIPIDERNFEIKILNVCNRILVIYKDLILVNIPNPLEAYYSLVKVNPPDKNDAKSYKIILKEVSQDFGYELVPMLVEGLKWADSFFSPIYLNDKDTNNNLLHIYNNFISRRAIAMPFDSEIVYQIPKIKGAYLEFEYNFLANSTCPRRDGTLQVEFLDTKNDKVLYSEAYSCNKRLWEEKRIDLSKYIGKRLRFVIRSSIERGGNIEDMVLFLANPIIRAPQNKNDLNVLLISLDTLRSDHLGCYGYKRNTSPVIDSLANEGILFENSFSHSSWTLPAHLSIFTGLYPNESGHRICNSNPYNNTELNSSRLLPQVKSLPEYLKEYGYKTFAATGAGYVSALYGFDEGFEVYCDVPDLNKARVNRQTRIALDWIRDNKDHKWFMFYHHYEIHAPYLRNDFKPDSADGEAANLIAMYDSCIKNADYQLGLIINELKKQDMFDKTIIIVTSDHGESFYNHKTGKIESLESGRHGHTLYDNLIKVPLIFSGYKDLTSGKRYTNLVRHVDILPTVLEILEIPYDKKIRGASLTDIIDDKDTKDNRIAYSEAVRAARESDEMKALRTSKDKIIFHMNGSQNSESFEYYNVDSDPGETKDLSDFSKHKSRISVYRSTLIKIQKSIISNYRSLGVIPDMNKDITNSLLNNQLKALGYLGN